MAKKRDKKEEVKKEREVIDISDRIQQKLTFKHWISRTIGIGLIFVFVVFLVEKYVKQDLLYHTLVAIGIVLFLGFFHEALHYWQAIRLGYKPKWWRTSMRMGFEIEHDNPKQWQRDNKKIAMAPYVVILPIAVVLFAIGLYLDNLGLLIAGLGTLLLHSISFPMEGR